MTSIANLPKEYGPDDLRFAVEFTGKDHANAQPTRPHVWQMYEGIRRADFTVRYNIPQAAANCVIPEDQLIGWAGELPSNAEIAETDIDGWAIENVSNNDARPLASIGLLWDLFGPFDQCPY